MTEAARKPDPGRARLRRRYAAEARFRLYGMLAVGAALVMLGVLLVKTVAAGHSGFTQTFVALDVRYDPASPGFAMFARALEASASPR